MKRPQLDPPRQPAVTDLEPADTITRPSRRTVLVVKGKPSHVMAELKHYALGESRVA